LPDPSAVTSIFVCRRFEVWTVLGFSTAIPSGYSSASMFQLFHAACQLVPSRENLYFSIGCFGVVGFGGMGNAKFRHRLANSLIAAADLATVASQ